MRLCHSLIQKSFFRSRRVLTESTRSLQTSKMARAVTLSGYRQKCLSMKSHACSSPDQPQQSRIPTCSSGELATWHFVHRGHATQSPQLRANLGVEPTTRTAHCITNSMRREATARPGATAVQAAHLADACTRRLTSSDAVSPWR